LKVGHGGTLDPLATGVLILGIGSGTKSLGHFLGCTKSYETVLLFGKATDTYDTEGKIVAEKPYEHVTKSMVEEALEQFRGKIMQKPPIFSAIRIDGKRLYEYAREGKEVPREIEERPVEVESLEMTEWMEGGTHDYHWPDVQADQSEKVFANKVLHLDADATAEAEGSEAEAEAAPATSAAEKRKRDDETVSGTVEPPGAPSPKRTKSDSEPLASGALPDTTDQFPSDAAPIPERDPCPAPACRIRMTVTSGFYVRSLCHDLGAAVNSLGTMASLIRSRQGDFELGKNVFEYADLARGEEHWAPQVHQMLDEWTEERAATVAEAAAAAEIVKAERGGKVPDKKRGGSKYTASAKSKKPGSGQARRNSSSGEN
jgi:tRNA pseudouridine55 synthase